MLAGLSGLDFASFRNVDERRERTLDGSPRMARTISSRPRRSAIRIVAELMPLVDCSSFFRKRGGTSATDRKIWILSPTEMKIVELLTVRRDMRTLMN